MSELKAVTRTEELAEEIRQLAARAASDIVDIGLRLIEARKILRAEGKWTTWLDQEFNWTPRTATNFIRAAKVAKKHPRLLGIQSPSILYLLTDPSEEMVDQLLKSKSYTEAEEIVEAVRWAERSLAKIHALQKIDYDQVRAKGNWKTMELAQETASRILAEMESAMTFDTARSTAVRLYRDYGAWLAELSETDPVENVRNAGLTLRERHGEPANGRVKAKLYDELEVARLTVWCPDPHDIAIFPRTENVLANAWRVTFMEACLGATKGNHNREADDSEETSDYHC